MVESHLALVAPQVRAFARVPDQVARLSSEGHLWGTGELLQPRSLLRKVRQGRPGQCSHCRKQ